MAASNVRHLPTWLRQRAHRTGGAAGARVTGMAEDIRGIVSDHIKQYVTDHSSRNDTSIMSYHEVFSSLVAPGTGGLSRAQVNGILASSGAWDSLSGVQQHAVCKCVSPGIDDLGKAVLNDMTGSEDAGLTWAQFRDASNIPLPPDPDVPVGKEILWGVPEDYDLAVPPRGAVGVPDGFASQDGTAAGVAPYWFAAPGTIEKGAAENDKWLASLTDAQIETTCASIGMLPASGGVDSCITAYKQRRSDAQSRVASGNAGGAGFLTVSPAFLKALPKHARPAPPIVKPMSVGKRDAITVGTPIVLAGLGALRWGWLGFAAGGAVGVVAVGIAYALGKLK